MILNLNELTDTHAHLNDPSFNEDRKKVVIKAQNSGVKNIFDVGTSLESSRLAIKNAREHKNIIRASVGIDPYIFIPGSEIFQSLLKSEDWYAKSYDSLLKLIIENSNHIGMIGETGVDKYWLKKSLNENKIDREDFEVSIKSQTKLFKLQLELAEEVDLPVTVHTRNAESYCLEIIKNHDAKGIFHSYTGSYRTACQALDQGWGLGVNGIATFRNSVELRKMYKKILGEFSSDWSPEDFYEKGIYFETDSPYLSPEGRRGGRNEPASVKDVFKIFSSR